MKGRTIFWLLAAACLVLLAAFVVHLLRDGLSARATPSKIETVMARNARNLSISKEARSAKNPVTGSPDALREARLHFADHCASCHGNDGSGDTLLGRGLYPKPPDFRLAETQSLTDGEMYWIIENGVRFTGMPAFASHGSENASWKLVLFIRHLPQLSAAEKVEMERYNPKGPDDRAEEQEENDFLNGTPTTPEQNSPHHHH